MQLKERINISSSVRGAGTVECATPGVTTARLAEGSGAARHLQKVLLKLDKIYFFREMHFWIPLVPHCTEL
jgi:hypothetical protein